MAATTTESTTTPAEPTIVLISSDNVEVTFTRKAAVRSKIVSSMMEDLNIEDCAEIGAIPVSACSGKMLKLVCQYSEHHRNDPQDPPPPVYNPDEPTDPLPTTNIVQWDYDFIKKLGNSELVELLCSANYLDNWGLMDLIYKSIANTIKLCKDEVEVRKAFDLPDDFELDESQRHELLSTNFI